MNGTIFHPRTPRWLAEGIPVGRVAGVALGLHPILILLALLWAHQARSYSAFLLDLNPFGLVLLDGAFPVALLLFTLLGSLLLHELGHVAALRFLHLSPRRIVLLPLGGGTPTPGGDRSPYAEFLTALAGPAVSLALAVGATVVHQALPQDIAESAARDHFRDFIAEAAYINWLVFGANAFLPLFPLDCARIIRSLLAMRYEPRKSTYDLALGGLFVAALLVLVFAAMHLLPYDSGYAGTSPFLSSLLLATALYGGLACHAQMRHVQESEVYADPAYAQPLFESLFPARPERPRGAEEPNAFEEVARDLQGRIEPPRPRRPRRAREPREESAPRTEAPASAAPPAPSAAPARDPSPRERLMRELDEAVKTEDFVRAARIRDQIRALDHQESHTS